MKVAKLTSFSPKSIQIETAEKPSPKGKEVLVRLQASSLNYRDYLLAIGTYNPRQKLPLIPLCDGAGIVEEVGPEVKNLKVGDQVIALFAEDWMDGDADFDILRKTLGSPLDGCACEYRIFQEHSVILAPSHLEPKESATLTCAGLTAWNSIFTFGNLTENNTVLILGTGGVSLFALQFAKGLGHKVIVTSKSDEKLEKASKLGADYLINYSKKQNWEREVRKITNMKGADLVVEVGGAGTLQKSIASCKSGGVVSLIGVLAGGETSLSLYPILMLGIRIQGVIVGNKANFTKMNEFITKHKMKPVLDKDFPLEELSSALEYLETGNHFGKVTISI